MSKICFTIMGFGKKTDYPSGKTYDLDKTYHNIIKPVVEKCGYTSVRADEIQESGLIDKSMYALLIKADLVIADITTLNPNALYELGIRHAARPKFTIILKGNDGNIPFDLNHTRFLTYTVDSTSKCNYFIAINQKASYKPLSTNSSAISFVVVL